MSERTHACKKCSMFMGEKRERFIDQYFYVAITVPWEIYRTIPFPVKEICYFTRFRVKHGINRFIKFLIIDRRRSFHYGQSNRKTYHYYRSRFRVYGLRPELFGYPWRKYIRKLFWRRLPSLNRSKTHKMDTKAFAFLQELFLKDSRLHIVSIYILSHS